MVHVFSAERRCCIDIFSVEKNNTPEGLWSQACRSEELQTLLSVVLMCCRRSSTLCDNFNLFSVTDRTLFLQKLCFQTRVTLIMVRFTPYAIFRNPKHHVKHIYTGIFWVHCKFSPVKSHTVVFLIDYETLRTTGVVLAAIMFVSGILIALSKFRLSYITLELQRFKSYIQDHLCPCN